MDTLILDLLDPEEARTLPTALKDYSDELKVDAVALYESTPGATYKDITADLGITRATLRECVLRDRERRSVASTGPRAGATPAARAGSSTASADPDVRGCPRPQLKALV